MSLQVGWAWEASFQKSIRTGQMKRPQQTKKDQNGTGVGGTLRKTQWEALSIFQNKEKGTTQKSAQEETKGRGPTAPKSGRTCPTRDVDQNYPTARTMLTPEGGRKGLKTYGGNI